MLVDMSQIDEPEHPATLKKADDTTPLAELTLAPCVDADLAELLVLQRCCWVQEAIDNDTLHIAALHETSDDVAEWATSWRVWCVRSSGRLVAAVRARAHDTTWEIGRLMVAPDLAGRGIGRWLLAYAERQAPTGTTTYALSTGRGSKRNIAIYTSAGYAIASAPADQDDIHLTKPRGRVA